MIHKVINNRVSPKLGTPKWKKATEAHGAYEYQKLGKRDLRIANI